MSSKNRVALSQISKLSDRRPSFPPKDALLAFKSHSSFPADNVLMCCKFCPSVSSSEIACFCDEKGYVSLLNTATRIPKVVQNFHAHSNAIMDMCWMHDPKQIVTASGDETCVLWDAEKGVKLQSFHGHEGTVRCVTACATDDFVFASGSRDGSIALWDVRSKSTNRPMLYEVFAETMYKPVNKIYGPHSQVTLGCAKRNPYKGRNRIKRTSTRTSYSSPKEGPCCPAPSVMSLLYMDLNTLVSASQTASSCLRMWDLRKSYTNFKHHPQPAKILDYAGDVQEGRIRYGFTNLAMDRYHSSIFALCTDNTVYRYSLLADHRDMKSVQQFKGSVVNSFYCRISVCPTADYLLCGGSNGQGCIWDMHRHMGDRVVQPAVVLGGHEARELSGGVSWSNNFGSLITCDDERWRLWSLDDKSDPDIKGDTAEAKPYVENKLTTLRDTQRPIWGTPWY